jgi:predicted PurR-regulated permease PerM
MTSSPVPLPPVDEPIVAAALPAPRVRPSNVEIAAWILIGGLLLYLMMWHRVSALIPGLVLYLILDRLAVMFARRMPGGAARPLALLLVTLLVGGAMFGGIALTMSLLRQHAERVPEMMTKMADILSSTRAWLGGYGEEIIPEVLTDAETVKAALVDWLKRHAAALKIAGSSLGFGLIHAVMGVLLAILVFFRHVTHHDAPRGPLSVALADKVHRFADAFARVATAQVKISTLNTFLTALYVLVALPMFGIHLPFPTTIILVTFICGLIPVLGNLISNTVIVILSLGISFGTAVASLTFLVVIHKLEYLINSRIVGGETDSQAWEILLAILIGEAAFGIGGVVMAPIIYAFVKRELRDRGLV